MSHPGSCGFSIYLSPGEATPSKLPAPEHIRRDPVFLQLLIKRRFRDRENFTRRRYASAMSSQLLNDDLLLEQVHQFGQGGRRERLIIRGPILVQSQHKAECEVTQLPHITGPRMR